MKRSTFVESQFFVVTHSSSLHQYFNFEVDRFPLRSTETGPRFVSWSARDSRRSLPHLFNLTLKFGATLLAILGVVRTEGKKIRGVFVCLEQSHGVLAGVNSYNLWSARVGCRHGHWVKRPVSNSQKSIHHHQESRPLQYRICDWYKGSVLTAPRIMK